MASQTQGALILYQYLAACISQNNVHESVLLGIQQLLSAEKRAADKINDARKRKARRLKQAKEEAQQEIEKYRQVLSKHLFFKSSIKIFYWCFLFLVDCRGELAAATLEERKIMFSLAH